MATTAETSHEHVRKGEVHVWWAARGLPDQPRAVLSRYLGPDATEVELAEGEHGKPYLPGRPHLHFGISHSGPRLAIAVAAGPVGIDVERVRRVRRLEAIAQRFLAAGEASALAALPPQEKLEAFHRLWTAKEAYVKALGTGLRTPLRSFELDLATLEPATGGPERLSVAAIDAPPGYAAAVAVHGSLRQVRVRSDGAPGAR